MVSGGGIASDFAPVFHLLEDKWEGKPEAEDDLQLIINLEVNFVAPVTLFRNQIQPKRSATDQFSSNYYIYDIA